MDYQFISKETSSTIIKGLVALTQCTLLRSSLRILLVRLVIDYCTNHTIWNSFSTRHTCIRRIIENKLIEYALIGHNYKCMFQPFVLRVHFHSVEPTPCINTQDVYLYMEYRLYGPHSMSILDYRSGWDKTMNLQTGCLIVDSLLLLESSVINPKDKTAIRSLLNEYVEQYKVSVPKDTLNLCIPCC